MRVLLVKLSSMGDVLHNLPVVSDLARAYPDIEIDWVTEAPYAKLVALHPKVQRVIPIHLRELKQRWWSPAAWSTISADRAQLKGSVYDTILDTQGLIKSALVCRAAVGPITGFSPDSAREPVAALGYDRHLSVPRNLHAVERNRRLAAGIFGYRLGPCVDYGLQLPKTTPNDVLVPPYIVFLHATSRIDKRWPELSWIALGHRLHERGLGVVLPWGDDNERRTSERLASAIPGARVPAKLSLVEAATLLSQAQGVIGVDTGLAHLSVALARPTVGLYLTTSPALTGLYGSDLALNNYAGDVGVTGGSNRAINLGGGSPHRPVVPSVADAWDALLSQLPPI